MGFRLLTFGILAVVCFAVPLQTSGRAESSADTSAISLTVKTSRTSYAPGDTGELSIALSPIDGFHVNAEPPVRFVLDTSTVAELTGNVQQVIDARTGYLRKDAAIRQKFAVSKDAVSGTYTLSGSAIYFYCSDSEGWCRRNRHPVSFSLMVRK